PLPPQPTLLPYTTLFRSAASVVVTETPKESAAARLAPATAMVHVPSAATAPVSTVSPTVNVTSSPAVNSPVTVPVTSTVSPASRSEEHTSELQSRENLVC